MNGLESFDPLYSLSGFFVGILVGMTGVGGGSLMTPLLILLFGVHPAVAVGTDLLYASVTKSVGTITHGIANSIDWKIVGRLAMGSVPASALTIYWLSVRGVYGGEIGSLITSVMGIALIATSVSLVLRARILVFSFDHFGSVNSKWEFGLTCITGIILGVVVSITSVGAGALGIVVLMMLYPKLPMSRIVGSDIAHAVPLTLIAGIGHWRLGSVDWLLLVSLLSGSIPGVLVGVYAATCVRESVIRIALAAVLAVVALRLLFA
nr:MAG: sulfite exporter TauE/SafE family protein [Hyphomicrobiales bacterium]